MIFSKKPFLGVGKHPHLEIISMASKKWFLAPCSFGLSATSQQYFSLRTNQPPATSQQYFSLRTNQHQPSATSQTNRLSEASLLAVLAEEG
jgi:uncharacterized lipoprotein YmbA